MATKQTRWHITGDYFENCNCKVVCPCILSPNQPLTSRPTEGACEIAFAFHITSGSYDNITLEGLNVAMIARAPGPLAEGNWSVALYLDEGAKGQQRQALAAIFSGSAGGPLGALAPLISTVLGSKSVPITYHIEGKRRSVEIPNIMHLAVILFQVWTPTTRYGHSTPIPFLLRLQWRLVSRIAPGRTTA